MKKLLVLLALILLSVPFSQAQNTPETAYIAWHPDGTMLAVAYKSHVDIVDVNILDVLHTFTDVVTYSPPAWSPDGQRLAIGNLFDVEVWSQPWNPVNAQRDIIYKYYEPGSTNLVSVDVIVFSPDGTRIASSFGGGIDIWNSSTGDFILRLPGEDFVWDWVTDMKWTDDNRLAIANISGWIPVVDTEIGETVSVYVTGGASYNYGSWALDFNPDGNQLAIGGREGIIEIWGDTRVVGELVEQSTLNYYGHGGNEQPITTLDWNPLGKFIASGDADGKIRVWDAETGEDYLVIDLGTGVHIDTVAWSPDGTQLAYVDAEEGVQIVPVLELPDDEQ